MNSLGLCKYTKDSYVRSHVLVNVFNLPVPEPHWAYLACCLLWEGQNIEFSLSVVVFSRNILT